MLSTGCWNPSREYVLHARLLLFAPATYRSTHEAGGVKKVVKSGTVAVAIYDGMPAVVVIDIFSLAIRVSQVIVCYCLSTSIGVYNVKKEAELVSQGREKRVYMGDIATETRFLAR